MLNGCDDGYGGDDIGSGGGNGDGGGGVVVIMVAMVPVNLMGIMT